MVDDGEKPFPFQLPLKCQEILSLAGLSHESEVRISLLILGGHVLSFCVQIMKCCAAAWLLWNAGKGKGVLLALRI